MKLDPILHHTHKSTENGLKTYGRPETVKLLEENLRVELHDIALGKELRDMTPNHGKNTKTTINK